MTKVIEKNNLPFSKYASLGILNFNRLFEFWEKKAGSSTLGTEYAAKVLKELDNAKILRKPIRDLSILKKYEKEIALLLEAVFPPMLTLNEIKAAVIPFTNTYFFKSERLKNIIKAAEEKEGEEYIMNNVDEDEIYIAACTLLLNSMYQTNIDLSRQNFITIPNKATGVVRHYRIFMNADYVDFKLINKKFNLSDDDIEELLDNVDNIDLWLQKIPPGTFGFEGFLIMNLFDVTSDVELSQLKADLLDKESIQNPYELVERLEKRLRIIFKIPELRFGYARIDDVNQKISSADGNRTTSLLLRDPEKVKFDDVLCPGALSCLGGKVESMIVTDVESRLKQHNFLMDKELLAQGIKSYLFAPIRHETTNLGVLELGTPTSRRINPIVFHKLKDILPTFQVAIKRKWDEYQTQLEAIIQEKCTAIHPSVSWRFFNMAENWLQARSTGSLENEDDILFDHVYPLFGQSDIMGSSTARNDAIQADLIEQLLGAKSILTEATTQLNYPVFNEFNYRLEKHITSLRKELHAGDEISILDFLKSDIYPVFNHIKTLNKNFAEKIQAYEDSLDAELGVIYKERRLYEESVTRINEMIGGYLEKKQLEAQKMFPHYFEKYKTDGVEYNMYIGQSIVQNKKFDEIYLHNIRLWQLLTMCGVENYLNDNRHLLPIPFYVRSLILVHSSAITIRFRMDEKQFDVDGAYNIRYEIIKKRIDKAYIKGTNERLTQPKKIAIVYSQPKDRPDYEKYLKYLQSINKIGPNIEYLDLEELQGASGLKAIRVEVVFNKKANTAKTNKKAISYSNK